MINLSRLAKFSWIVLAYTVLVILWGAFVRATGSGAGCGNHWPLCNGEVVPRPEMVETVIEFTHRAMTGLLLPLVLILVIGVFRQFGKGHPARKAVFWTVFFLITESLIGAGLVRFELVAGNASASRAAAGALHLLNTYLLLAATTLTAWWVSGGPAIRWRSSGPEKWALAIALGGMLVLGASGAVTALGDTLFPSESLAAGLQQDLSPTAHFLIRLRVLHPLLALIVGLYTIAYVALTGFQGEIQYIANLARAIILLVVVQLGLGVVNVFLLAPVWMQILHLLVADLIWISLVLFGAARLGTEVVDRTPKRQVAASPTPS